MIKNFSISIGEIPTSYLESMSYAEMLAWMCKYLDDTVGAKINEMIEGINNIQIEYDDLKVYIDSEILELKNYTDGQIEILQNEIGNIGTALDIINGEVIGDLT